VPLHLQGFFDIFFFVFFLGVILGPFLQRRFDRYIEGFTAHTERHLGTVAAYVISKSRPENTLPIAAAIARIAAGGIVWPAPNSERGGTSF
jgi:hypothetical protein